jgi:multidrug efflux pump subunit AcrA (membrane-fusion protein)
MIVTPVTRIIPSGNPTSHMFRVRIALDNSQRMFSPGMSATAMIPTGSSGETLTVHRDAIVRQPAGEIVYFDAGGVAAMARVRSLFGVGDRVAISSEQLPPTAKVVIEGNERLFPGQPLNIVGEGPAPRRAERGQEGAGEGAEAGGPAGSGN